MADSEITVSGLTATGGVGQIALGWSVTEASCLPYLRLDKVEIWEATTNNRDAAVKIAEIFGAQYVRTGLARSTARRYWIRARDASGNLGDWFPSSSTAGILGATTSNPPSASVLSDVSSNAGSIVAGNIDGVTITGALIRTKSSGARIEIDSVLNALSVFNAGGGISAQIRVASGTTIATFAGSMGAEIINAQNNGSGPAASFVGSSTNPAVLSVTNQSSGSGRDAARIQNEGGSGGSAYIGRSSSNGGYALYANRGGIGPFTGQHDALIRKAETLDEGDIVIDLQVLLRKGIDDTVTEVGVSSRRGQKGAIGVVSRRTALDRLDPYALLLAALPDREDETCATLQERLLCYKYDHLTVNSVGEGQINVCGRGGNIEAGDLLITSSMRGKAERQGDEIVYSFTVAKAREDVTFSHPDEVRLVACTYHCG